MINGYETKRAERACMSLEMIQQNAKTFLEAAYEFERRAASKDRKGAEQILAYMNALVASMKAELGKERK